MWTRFPDWREATFHVCDEYQDGIVSGFEREGFRVHEHEGVAHLVQVPSLVFFGLFDTVDLAMFAGELATIGLEGGDFSAMDEEERRQAFDLIVDSWMLVGMAAIGSYDAVEGVWHRLTGPGGVTIALGTGPDGPNCAAQTTLEVIDQLIEDLVAARAESLKGTQQAVLM